MLIGVPLLLEKMYNRIWQGLRDNKLAYTLFRLGIRKPVIHGIPQKLGGKLRMMVSGGAPCDPDLLRGFMKARHQHHRGLRPDRDRARP